MSIHIISATEASRTLSNILNKVHYQGESYEIKRGKEIIAKIIPVEVKKTSLKVSELNALFKKLPSLDDEDRTSFEKDIQDIRANTIFEDKSWD